MSVMGLGEEDHRGKVSFSSHYSKDISSVSLITVDVGLDPLAGVIFFHY